MAAPMGNPMFESQLSPSRSPESVDGFGKPREIQEDLSRAGDITSLRRAVFFSV
jgi:hypothetical protein